MKVRTIRKHGNGHPPTYRKNVGRKYDLPEREAASLIAAGLVAAVDAGGAADEADSAAADAVALAKRFGDGAADEQPEADGDGTEDEG